MYKNIIIHGIVSVSYIQIYDKKKLSTQFNNSFNLASLGGIGDIMKSS